MKVHYLVISIIICSKIYAMEQNCDAGAPGDAGIQPSLPARNVVNTNQVASSTVQDLKTRYKSVLMTQKAYELAQTYLYASPGKNANPEKAAAILYQAGYDIPTSHRTLGIVVTNLLLGNGLQINNLKMFWNEKINCASLEQAVDQEWKTARSAYENAKYSLLQD